MKCAGCSLSKPFVRLIALIICYSVVSPYCVLLGTDRFRSFPIVSKAPRSRPKPAGKSTQTPTPRYRDGELLVRFKDRTPQADIDALLQTHGLRRVATLVGPSGVERLALAQGIDPVTVATALRTNQAVAFAEPNFLISADTVTPNDPRFGEQWALNDSGADIGVMSAWDSTTGSTRTIIAVIDSGVDFTHTELKNNQWINTTEQANNRDDDGDGYIDDLHGWDFVAGDKIIRDEQGHGTAVAGIIAAEGNNGVGIAGVMWRASLMSLRVLDSSGTGDIAGAVQAVDYAASHGAQVINLSWGLEDGSSALLEAIDRAGARGALVVCSAGNNARDIDITPHFPASFDLPNIIAVAATNNANLLASWSNRGTKRLVKAPGANILTTKMGGDYQAVNGTSASAAFVSGIAGLLRSVRPWLSGENTGRIITSGTRSILAPGDTAPSDRIADAGRALGELRQLAPNEGLTRNSGANGGDHEPGPSPPPVRGLPGATLPTLETIRRLPQSSPQAPPPIPSTMPNRVWESLPVPTPVPTPTELAFSRFSNDPLETAANPVRSELSLVGQLLGVTRDVSDTDFSVFSSFLPRSGAASVFLPPQYSSNLALNKPATQSTTHDPITSANKAVDGNTNGDLWSGYTAATNYQYQPWWQVDLQSVQSIGAMEIWPRTDCCTEHLANFYVLVSETPFASTDLATTINQAGVSNYYAAGNSFTPTAVSINRAGRYVRVQRSDSQYLVISEAQVWASSLTSARLDPNNRTGVAGDDLLSRNFNWGISVLGLRGRAGLDLGLSLSYNSLVWTRHGNTITFDEDYGSPTPGFRLGFPVIDNRYYSDQLGRYGYLMVTPSGRRVEFRQIGTTNTYETFDSSYLQLIDNGTWLLVKTTDGTQMTYASSFGKFRCTEVKDSNGNFISINHNSLGITTITDTLSRVITFNYDGFGNLQSITQPWRREIEGGGAVNETHQWATFGYAPIYIGYNFPGLTAVGPNGMSITMLSQVGLPDGSRYNFEYNSYGQITTIRNYSSDNVQRSYIKYDLTASSTDCPRISARRVWAHSWNGDTDGTPAANEEAVTTYNIDGDSAHTATLPDSTVYKEYYGIGWQSGLVTLAEWWTGSTRQKYTTTTWTQDNTGVTYEVNPRVTETNVYDTANNRRRTRADYTSVTLPSGTSCKLPSDIYEYQADGNTVYRRSHIDYLIDAAYLNQRIIGLPSGVTLYDAGNVAQSITLYRYDWASHLELIPGSINPPQHDAYFNSTSVTTRGNLVSVLRISTDTNDPPNTNTEFKWAYNIAGSVTLTRDHIWHQQFFYYDDNFSDGLNRNTFAYPKTLRDGDWNDTSVQYNYDMGVTTRIQGPPPVNNPQGAIQSVFYDAAGRSLKQLTVNNGAYTRFFYGPNFLQTYATIKDLASEAYSYTGFDGLGRVIASASSFPGSSGGYRGVQTGYDNMGRTIKQSNPTETSATGPNWLATGDDSALGANWLYTQQAYNWQGRPTITTNTDNSQKTVSYTGCGCAGGQVVTLTDETSRRERVTHDVLGRPWKSEVLNFDGTTYSTTTANYTVRDQATLIRQFQGTDASTTYQDTVMGYDGFGRLKTQKRPEQTNPTVYSYWEDDTIKVITDARGATITHGYNGRHQVTSLVYGGGYSAPNVTIGYDAAGNRSSMSDGIGNVTYNYDQLSRLTSETRFFTELGQSFTLTYGYNVGGQVTSVAEPSQFGSTVSYAYDLAGQLTGVTGSGSGSAPNYATGLQYRAWGGLRHLNYGNTLTLDLTYNNRLQTTQYDLKTGGGARVMGLSYQHDNAHRLTASTDLVNSNLNRSYDFDHAGRLVVGDTANGTLYGPYKQTYNYDVWGNLTYRSWRTFTTNQFGTFPVTNSATYSYSNNRNTAAGWTYDADGRLLASVEGSSTFNYGYDAAGRMTSASEPGKSITQSFDGDVLRAKWVENGDVTYYVRSTVLAGQAITELNASGGKRRGYVYAGGQVVAKQESGQVLWDQRDVSGVSMRVTNSVGGVTSRIETDPLGTIVDDTQTYNYGGGGNGYGFNPIGSYGSPGMPNMGCSLDGVEAPCSMVMNQLRAGAAVECPNNNCGPQIATATATYANGQSLSISGFNGPFRAYADGRSGYGPLGGALLPAGFSISEIGAPARIAAIWFNYGINFQSAVAGAVRSMLESSIYSLDASGLAAHSGNMLHGPQKHEPLSDEQKDIRDLVYHGAGNRIALRPECRKYITGGRKVNALRLLGQAVKSMSYDPDLDPAFPAETDPGIGGRIRLGRSFFNLTLRDISVVDEFQQLLGMDVSGELSRAIDQRVFIMLHEFRHSATGKQHKTLDDYKQWLKDLYDNCFRPK